MKRTLALLVACAAGLAACDDAKGPEVQIRPVRTTKVERRVVSERIVMLGQIKAQDDISMAFLIDGRLDRIPAQEKKRLVVLQFLAETDFEPDRSYPEKEVNQILALRHPDSASLRRYLVDLGYMERSASVYRLLPRENWPTLEASALAAER